MKYIVYLTTNLKSKVGDINKIYIGVHKTENPDIFDGYIGCGVYINKPSTYMYPKTPFQYAVKKYGVNAFKRDILYIYDSKEDAFKKESEIVNDDFISYNHTYNVAVGGIGGCLKSIDPRVHSLPLYQFNTDGTLVKKWECTLDASDFYETDYINFLWAITDHLKYLDFYWARKPNIDINLYKSTFLKITYLYTLQGKLILKFKSRTECALFLGCVPQSVSNAVRNNHSIKGYYVSDKLYDIFIPSPRKKISGVKLFLYHKDKGFIGTFLGKEIMPLIGVFSFNKINSAINDNRGWYKDFFISLSPVESVPEKYTHNKKVEVYNKNGQLIEILNSVKEVKEKYNLNSASINRILKGIKLHNDYIFKYSK